MNPVVELVTTGNELLNGRTINRHANVLGEQLSRLGLSLSRDTTVPDKIDVVADCVSAALNRADIVLVTGGLGPTSDDITREALSAVLNRKIVLDRTALDAMSRRYAKLGRSVTASAERQVQVLEGAAVLSNSAGAAPGQRIELDNKKILFVLPGPPREFNAILNEHVVPWLRTRVIPEECLVRKIFMICGMGESDVATRLGDGVSFPPEGVSVAYCARPGCIEVRLTVPEKNMDILKGTQEQVRKLLGHHIFAESNLLMEEVIGRLLAERKATLATAESCTGGYLGHRITSVSGSSSYYLGGVVAYSNDVKVRELGVKKETLGRFGAVSEETAREMAEGVRARFGADYGVSVTGVAGPEGGTPEKPVGLVFVGLADQTSSWARRFTFAGDRMVNKEWSSQMAMDLLRHRLLEVLT